MARKRGGPSVIRIGLIAGLIGIVLIGAGVLAFFADQASRQTPFNVDIFPGAETWGERYVTDTSRNVFYKVPNNTVEEVAAFYQQKLHDHAGSTQENCVRIPPSGAYAITDSNSIPYQYVCMFDRSGFRTTQFTRVLVYPGAYNSDPYLNTEGMAVIKYEQQWQP